MSVIWLQSNKSVFVRDLLRDFCEVYSALMEQNDRFAASGTISHAVLRDLLGREMRKGVFWRLKDTSHHLFRVKDPVYGASLSDDSDMLDAAPAPVLDEESPRSALEGLIDWCLGYAFHECVKLKEDAFQRQHYANRLTQMREALTRHLALVDNLIPQKLEPLTVQTRESIGREMTRILHVLSVARTLLIQYVQGCGDNGYVARYLMTENAVVRKVFSAEYAGLLHALYGDAPEQCWLLAADACLRAGRPEQALHVLDQMDAAHANSPKAQALRKQALAFDGRGNARGRDARGCDAGGYGTVTHGTGEHNAGDHNAVGQKAGSHDAAFAPKAGGSDA